MMRLTTVFKSRHLLSRNNFTQDAFGLQPLMSCAGLSMAANKGFTSGGVYGNTSTVVQKDFTKANERAHSGKSTVGQRGFTNDRISAKYCVYKGKAAFSAEPVSPRFNKYPGGIRVSRAGCIILSFAPSIGERKYDWQKKQIFALSVTEVGSLIALADGGSCEFFHDPAMKSSNAGQVRKTLSVKATPEGNAYFISISVVNAAQKTSERLSLPLTNAEFAVMRTSFSFVLPYIMGWDRYTIQMPVFEEKQMQVAQKSVDSEWDR